MSTDTMEKPARKPAGPVTVVAASAAGTVFEWYDFFIFGTLTPIISRHFFAGVGEAASFIIALFVFGIGFGMRPVGALFFGRIGDRVGRKGAFLITVTLMGMATFLIGFLPTYEQVGIWAPVLLIALRCVQGFALGGEYGGAAIYVTEHSPPNRRGAHTSWIQASASVGLVGALAVILAARSYMGEEAFGAWGWRIPFLISVGLLGVSLWIRLQLEESPVFQKIKDEGKASAAPLAESFLRWDNLRIVLLALCAVMIAQGVVWYTAHFYAQFFLERIVKLDAPTVNMLMIAVVAASAPCYVFFAWLSDRIGRKPVMIAGTLFAAIAFYPGFQLMTRAANPALADAMRAAPVMVEADAKQCSLQFDPIGKSVFSTSCDIAKSALANAGVSYDNTPLQGGGAARVRVGGAVVESVEGSHLSKAALAAARKDFDTRLKAALTEAGYPAKADPAKANLPLVFLILFLFVAAATALYGPQAAALVELFPARVRYTALSFPYHVGTGWFGGFLPAASFAIVAGAGNIFAGLWYPILGAAFSLVFMIFLLPETRGRPID
ncbi:MAG: MFS transporter [Hyphomonadaceae bacterium]